jgi:membrane protein implicated in regulation of membrane protease activity
MYIVAIGWIYVVAVMAAAEVSFIAGLFTFVLYGLLPVTVLALVFGRSPRRPVRSDETADGKVDQRDRADPEADQ